MRWRSRRAASSALSHVAHATPSSISTSSSALLMSAALATNAEQGASIESAAAASPAAPSFISEPAVGLGSSAVGSASCCATCLEEGEGEGEGEG